MKTTIQALHAREILEMGQFRSYFIPGIQGVSRPSGRRPVGPPVPGLWLILPGALGALPRPLSEAAGSLNYLIH